MSLLTDEEINEARAAHIGTPLKCWPQHRAIADASQTKTLKAVAEWLGERCQEHSHSREGGYRGICVSCVATLFAALHKGKMLGEE